MSLGKSAAALALVTLIAVPATAWAQGGGGPGCTNLPDYNRALGALQGMTSACDMSVEQARRIVAAHDGTAAPQQWRRGRAPSTGDTGCGPRVRDWLGSL